MCAEWENISKKGNKIFKLFKETDKQKLHKYKMINQITNFYCYLYNFLQDENDFTSS